MIEGLNPFAISHVINFFMSLVIGCFVFFKNRKKQLNSIFFLMCLCIAAWAFFWFLCEITDGERALFFARLQNQTSLYIPSFYLHFILCLIDKVRDKRKILIFVYSINTLVVILSLFFPNLFLMGVETKLGILNFPTRLGSLYHFFTILFFSESAYGILQLQKTYHQTSGIKKKQIRYTLLASLFGFLGGGSIFILAYNVSFYPWPNFAMSLWVIILSYAIIRYKALEIDTVIHRTLLWLLTSIWLIIPSYILLFFILPWLKRLNTLWFTFTELVLFYLFLNYYLIFQPIIDHIFRRRKYDYQTVLGKIAEKIATCINIEHLSRKLLTEVCATMYLSNGLFYLISKDEQKYKLIGRFSKGSKDVEIFDDNGRNTLALDTAEIKADSTFCSWLNVHHDVLEREHLEIDPVFETTKAELVPWFQQHSLEIIIPVLFENKIIGILALGKKENLQNYTLKDKELLKKLGEEAGVTIFNALHYKDVLEKDRLEEEVKMGQQIQMNLLPQGCPNVPGLEIVGYMHPAKEIGGDYYDFIQRPYNNEFAFVIGDVSGKGVGAGLVMSMVKMAINTLSKQMFSPKEILCATNATLHEQVRGEKFVTLLYFLWQPQEKKLTYSSAGHEHILFYHSKEQRIEAIMSGGIMLGMLPDVSEFVEEPHLALSPGDKVVLYTDGVTEARNQQNELFTLERLKSLFAKHCSLPPARLIESMSKDIFFYMEGSPQYDDITLVVLEVK